MKIRLMHAFFIGSLFATGTAGAHEDDEDFVANDVPIPVRSNDSSAFAVVAPAAPKISEVQMATSSRGVVITSIMIIVSLSIGIYLFRKSRKPRLSA